MYTDKERKNLRKQLSEIERCNGNCKECKHLDFVTSLSEHAIYYAFGCDICKDFSPISETMTDLRSKLLDQLKFELDE